MTTEHYTVGKWKGHDSYRCAYCRYKSLDYDALMDHIRQVHTEQYTVRPARGGLVDKSGKEMNVLEREPAKEPPVMRGDSTHEAEESVGPEDAEREQEKPSGWFR